MRKNYRLRKILITAVLCPALVLGMAACGQKGGNAGNGNSAAGEETAAGNESAGMKTEEVVFKPPVDTPFVTPREKDESVYVKADASGKPTEKSVEVVLKKIEGSDLIEDPTCGKSRTQRETRSIRRQAKEDICGRTTARISTIRESPMKNCR